MTSRTRQVVLSGLALAGTVAVLAGCASAPSESTTAKKTDFQPCMVSDAGGFDDKSFNQLGYEGMKDAAEEIGATVKEAESKDATVYDANIEQLISQNCNLVVTVGFNLADATKKQAAANPDTNFAIIDDNSIDADNVKPITFDTSQAAFLAGYAAASYSKTGVVGTFGGMQIPTVTIFMDGFADGVKYYNEQKDEDVKVVGWNVDTGKGSFTGGFEAGTQAKSVAQTLLDQDADVILPVGGPIYQSAAEAIKDADNGSVLIGADSDLYEADPRYKDIAFTSVEKGMRPAVKDVVEQAADDKFSKDPYVGTLENDGVGIAPFHDFESKVDKGLQGELDDVKAGIIDGSIKVKTQS
ncbi:MULTISPECIES: BMP family lipoprotein [Curtobacterium]|uniref:BMP family lipoprotein n=1 Tax=Curtobacterium TaxID=2034 RepID=UPI0018E530E5|nr:MULTISPECIES: BMP family ABC transporter substrate-binding protein [Curtobacterium]MCA5923414.1 BMP family ABC transporter substrate-binding protein [Curtobacterium oceanosedimentum]QQD75272.1 BMP family ABC transporter substrate-binding protein [Curtobacterium sp. YC1]